MRPVGVRPRNLSAVPNDIAALKAMVLASRAELRNRDLLIEKLKHQLAGLRWQRFGAVSEALDQLELGLEDEEIARAAEALPEPPPGAKRQPKRRPLSDHLPREEAVVALGDRCTACGGGLKRLGEDVCCSAWLLDADKRAKPWQLLQVLGSRGRSY